MDWSVEFDIKMGDDACAMLMHRLLQEEPTVYQ